MKKFDFEFLTPFGSKE